MMLIRASRRIKNQLPKLVLLGAPMMRCRKSLRACLVCEVNYLKK
jgi:hypothetical protein